MYFDRQGKEITVSEKEMLAFIYFMRKNKKALIAGGFAGFIMVLFALLLWPFRIVNTGHIGVVTRFGEVQGEVLNEGLHVVNPLDKVNQIDTKTQIIETEAEAASKDLQSVSTTIALNFRVKKESAKNIFQETSGYFEQTLIAPAIQETVKAATAQFTADELITRRADVKETIKIILSSKESMRFFVVEDILITNFSFSAAFDAAIENKVKAEQEALTAKNQLERTKYESEQKIVRAKAEAESLRIQAEALANNASLIKLEAIRKWNGQLPSHVLSDAVPFIDVSR